MVVRDIGVAEAAIEAEEVEAADAAQAEVAEAAVEAEVRVNVSPKEEKKC